MKQKIFGNWIINVNLLSVNMKSFKKERLTVVKKNEYRMRRYRKVKKNYVMNFRIFRQKKIGKMFKEIIL